MSEDELVKEQLFIAATVCPICGREEVLFVPFGERFACVDCVTRENGEDGDPGQAA